MELNRRESAFTDSNGRIIKEYDIIKINDDKYYVYVNYNGYFAVISNIEMYNEIYGAYLDKMLKFKCEVIGEWNGNTEIKDFKDDHHLAYLIKESNKNKINDCYDSIYDYARSFEFIPNKKQKDSIRNLTIGFFNKISSRVDNYMKELFDEYKNILVEHIYEEKPNKIVSQIFKDIQNGKIKNFIEDSIELTYQYNDLLNTIFDKYKDEIVNCITENAIKSAIEKFVGYYTNNRCFNEMIEIINGSKYPKYLEQEILKEFIIRASNNDDLYKLLKCSKQNEIMYLQHQKENLENEIQELKDILSKVKGGIR